MTSIPTKTVTKFTKTALELPTESNHKCGTKDLLSPGIPHKPKNGTTVFQPPHCPAIPKTKNGCTIQPPILMCWISPTGDTVRCPWACCTTLRQNQFSPSWTMTCGRYCTGRGGKFHLPILCDLFGMVKWPFKGLSDLQVGNQKVTLNHLVFWELLMNLCSKPSLNQLLNVLDLMFHNLGIRAFSCRTSNHPSLPSRPAPNDP